MAISSNVYAAAHFALELDNKKDLGLFRSIEGGGVKADVMTYAFGANKESGYKRWKLVGKPKFEDLKFQVGMSMSQPFYEWLKDFFEGVPTRKDGAIIAADYHYKERARRTFKQAMIKELVFPKLDAADKNAVYMNVSVAVEDIEFAKGNGEVIKAPEKYSAQKLWSACNFDFFLDDYPDACGRVTKVDSFTIKQNIIEHHVGGQKSSIKLPSPVEFPTIAIYLPEADAQPFMDHSMNRVGYGAHGNGQVRDGKTMNGHIQVRDQEQRPIFSVEFEGADVVSVTPDKSDAGSEELKLCKVELFTEKMSFDYPVMELE